MFSISFDTIDVSINIPAIFFPLSVTSFGHFNSGLIFKIFSIAIHNASDVAIGTSVAYETSNLDEV